MTAPANRPEYLQRMYVELNELGLKLASLRFFIDSGKADSLGRVSAYLLRLQMEAMTEYFRALEMRIDQAEMMEARKQ